MAGKLKSEKNKSKRDGAEQKFNLHFAGIYGSRWPALREALTVEPRRTTLTNPFVMSSSTKDGEGRAGRLQNYTLDEASLLPVRQLALEPGQVMADFCASPGGKSLASIFQLSGVGEWHCNDVSKARVDRLRAVFHDCLPSEILARIHFSCSDASQWGIRGRGRGRGRGQNQSQSYSFDRILVDAPCSGERHLMARPSELARWSFKGSQRLSVRQHALLCSALDCLKPEGRLVYSTCSISPVENDGVIEKLIKSRAGRFKIISALGKGEDESAEPVGEPTRHGWVVLPDTEGCGPIYSCAIVKL